VKGVATKLVEQHQLDDTFYIVDLANVVRLFKVGAPVSPGAGRGDGVRPAHKHYRFLLTHHSVHVFLPQLGTAIAVVVWLFQVSAPLHPFGASSKVWEQGMVCPVCPLFWPLTCRNANPCARLADTLQSLPCVGELGERGRLSLVHQAPTTVNAYCGQALCMGHVYTVS
jgi:hypothetical protein